VAFGVDVKAFAEKPLHDRISGAFYFGTAKALKQKYGHDVALHALALARTSAPQLDLRLRIAGEGEERQFLLGLTAQLGLTGCVDFLGNVPHAEMPQFLYSIHCGLYLSIEDSESFGVSVVETLACARPVVVSDVPGFVEIVEGNGVGIVVPRRSAEATAAAMIQIAQDHAAASTMGRNGASLVNSAYTIQKCVTDMISVYTTISSSVR
jgi:glycosyltransferase involved in cell wall biosynthesis